MVCTFCRTVQATPDVTEVADRVLSLEAPVGVHCPVCDHELETALIDDVPACHCPNCRGLLLSSTEFRRVVEDRRAAYGGPEVAVALPHPIEMERKIVCPCCHQSMEVHPYYGAGRAIIDSCAACQLIWIDQGELTSLERRPGRRSPAMMEVGNLVAGQQLTVTGEFTDPTNKPAETKNSVRDINLVEIIRMLLG